MWIKKILGILLAVIVILVIGAISLKVFVNPNNYKSMIVDAVYKNTGRVLTIDGNISWRFLPGIGVEIGKVALSNAQGFGDIPFVQMEEASVYVRLLPLLNKNIFIDKLVIKNADINLSRHRDGQTNWSDLLAANDTPQIVKVSNTSAPAKAEAEGMDLNISTIEIINSRLTWDDQMSGQKRVLSGFSFTGGLGSMQPFAAEGVADLRPENIQYTFDATGHYALDLKSKVFSGKNWKVVTQVSGVQNIPQGEKIELSFNSLQLDMTQGNFSADKFMLQAMGGQVNFSGDGQNVFSKPNFNGNLAVHNFDAKAVAMLLNSPIETADPNILRKINVEAKAMGSGNQFTFNPVAIMVDDTKLEGQLSVNDWQKKEIAFALKGNQINLDRYMAPKKASKNNSNNATKQTQTGSNKSSDIISSESDALLRTLKLSGHFSMDSVTIQKMVLSNLTIDMTAANGILQITPLRTNLYDGELAAKLTLNVQGAQPQWNVNAQLNNLNLHPMLSQIAAKEILTGRLSADSQLQMTGRNSRAMLQSLNGNAKFNIANGVLQGIDLGYWLTAGESLLNKKIEALASKSSGKTEFLAAYGNFVIKNGVANNQNLTIYSDAVYMHGAGQFNLVRETIDYAVQVSKSHRTADGKYEGSAKAIPLRITGTFSQPQVTLDTKGAQSVLIKGLIGGAVAGKVLGGQSSNEEETGTSGSSSSSSQQQTPHQQIKNILRGL